MTATDKILIALICAELLSSILHLTAAVISLVG